MHSIKKVEESARIAREAKRQKKMQEVDKLRKNIFSCYENIEGHERDFLDLSEGLLKVMPDLYSFWIMRREVLMNLKKKMEEDPSFTIFAEDEIEKLGKKKETAKKKKEDEIKEAASIDNDQPTTTGDTKKKSYSLPTFDDLLDKDTTLTEEALFTNPKSYSAWNHRRWLMTLYSKPPLQREIMICEKALSIDWRNFHVWDYRRFIVHLLNRTMDEELEFAQLMVKKNPSNYSAWHYRINLLLESGGKITDEMFIKEMESITEVCVVNSEDQTAWTYVNWLIERYFNQNNTRKGIDNVISFTDNEMVEGKHHSTIVLFDSATLDENKELIEIVDGEQEWIPRGKATTQNFNVSSQIWDIYSKVPVNTFFSQLDDSKHFSFIEEPKRRYINKPLLNEIYSSSPKLMSSEVQQCLQTFLDVCWELMKDNNETNPWEICASAYVLPIISGVNDEIKTKVIQLLEKVKACDHQRKEMYNSWADKIVLTHFLHQTISENDSIVMEALFEKEGKICFQFNDYSCLRPLAGLIKLDDNTSDDLPLAVQAQLRWFLPFVAK